MSLTDAERELLAAWWDSDWPSDDVADVLDLLGETVDAIVTARIEAFRAAAVAAIKAEVHALRTSDLPDDLSGAYYLAAQTVANLSPDSAPRPSP